MLKYLTLVWQGYLKPKKIKATPKELLVLGKTSFLITTYLNKFFYLKLISHFIGSRCSGYMSPEYAMEGCFSEKSDVYSFGVLLLEIVSGRKNTTLRVDQSYLSLIKYVSNASSYY